MIAFITPIFWEFKKYGRKKNVSGLGNGSMKKSSSRHKNMKGKALKPKIVMELIRRKRVVMIEVLLLFNSLYLFKLSTTRVSVLGLIF